MLESCFMKCDKAERLLFDLEVALEAITNAATSKQRRVAMQFADECRSLYHQHITIHRCQPPVAPDPK